MSISEDIRELAAIPFVGNCCGDQLVEFAVRVEALAAEIGGLVKFQTEFEDGGVLTRYTPPGGQDLARWADVLAGDWKPTRCATHGKEIAMLLNHIRGAAGRHDTPQRTGSDLCQWVDRLEIASRRLVEVGELEPGELRSLRLTMYRENMHGHRGLVKLHEAILAAADWKPTP